VTISEEIYGNIRHLADKTSPKHKIRVSCEEQQQPSQVSSAQASCTRADAYVFSWSAQPEDNVIVLCPGFFDVKRFSELHKIKSDLRIGAKDVKDSRNWKGRGHIMLHELTHLWIVGGNKNSTFEPKRSN
jgi:hypothetical protein